MNEDEEREREMSDLRFVHINQTNIILKTIIEEERERLT